MNLSEDVAIALSPLFEALPLEKAMEELVVRGAPLPEATMVESILKQPLFLTKGHLRAGLWLYVDDLDRSHRESQHLSDATGSYWHGIMHRREGDFGNSHYWFARVGDHPAISEIAGYDPRALIDDVRHAEGVNESALVDLQRREWITLFAWCCAHP
jgi:hypothetical protein